MAYKHSRNKERPGVYHVFHQAAGGRDLFIDKEDRRTFEYLLNRYLTDPPSKDLRGRLYPSFRGEVSLQARNVLTSHFHLVLWQKVPGGIARLMKRALGAYSRHFRQKYGFDGSLFAGEYRARRIAGPKQFQWRVAYVHFNHKRLKLDYEFSTHGLFLEPNLAPSWLDASGVLRAFGGLDAYVDYMSRADYRNMLDAELRFEEWF